MDTFQKKTELRELKKIAEEKQQEEQKVGLVNNAKL